MGTLPAAWLTRQRGRKVSTVVAALCYLVGAALNAGAANLAMLVIGRIWQGFGVGLSLQVRSCISSRPNPTTDCPTLSI